MYNQLLRPPTCIHNNTCCACTRATRGTFASWCEEPCLIMFLLVHCLVMQAIADEAAAAAAKDAHSAAAKASADLLAGEEQMAAEARCKMERDATVRPVMSLPWTRTAPTWLRQFSFSLCHRAHATPYWAGAIQLVLLLPLVVKAGILRPLG